MRNMQQIKTFHRTIRPLTPANNTNTEPWQVIQANLFGPWSFTNVTGKLCTIKALSIIDTATRWIKLIPYDDKRSESIALLFDRKWLCRYPRPFAVIFDNGTEFSTKFTKLLESYSILARPSTVKNPQTNSIVERVHQVIGDGIGTGVVTGHGHLADLRHQCGVAGCQPGLSDGRGVKCRC